MPLKTKARSLLPLSLALPFPSTPWLRFTIKSPNEPTSNPFPLQVSTTMSYYYINSHLLPSNQVIRQPPGYYVGCSVQNPSGRWAYNGHTWAMTGPPNMLAVTNEQAMRNQMAAQRYAGQGG
nr:hypothetical protein B0A51_01859 [Rachicladosporium sp. CCFEE 5018]